MCGFNLFILLAIGFLSACDLQPKILSFPDSVGDFIATRYPALLADPETQPEIYNSAATDYGVYASPELYGTQRGSDYVMYASVDDYIMPPTDVVAETPATTAPVDVGGEFVATQSSGDEFLTVPEYGTLTGITVARGDTLYSIAKKYNTSVDEIAQANNLSQPYTLSVGQKLVLPTRTANVAVTKPATAPANAAPSASHGTPTTTRVELSDIKVAPGDTLYSLSRKYSIPVNDLAVMNNLSAPFALSVGQTLRVPNLAENSHAVAVAPRAAGKPATATPTTAPAASKTNSANTKTPSIKPIAGDMDAAAKPAVKSKPKISSDPKKKLPAIGARSSSKFSWPVRGTILSHYGAKTGGLFNDGINIAATRGTAVGAAENGVVAYAGNEVKGMGNLIIIQHDGGWMTVYAHMDSLGVRRGTRVSVGQKIGTVGATGKVDTPQLHFEIRKGTRAYNPSQYLKK